MASRNVTVQTHSELSQKPSIFHHGRPNFAEDIYGSNKERSTGQTAANSASVTPAEICESALAQRRSAQLPKLKDITSRPRPQSADISARYEMNDFDFVYSDCDTHAAELAELYTYSEIEDWAANMHAFRHYVESKQIDVKWSLLSETQQRDIFYGLVELLDRVEGNVRLVAARCILYILQGAYMDYVGERDVTIGSAFCTEPEHRDDDTGRYEEKCLSEGIINAYKAYNAGVYQALCKMLMTEINDIWDCGVGGAVQGSRSSSVSNSRSASNVDLADSVEKRSTRRSATMVDNESLRVVLSCIYHMVESIRRNDIFQMVIPADKKGCYTRLRTDFVAEVEEPIEGTDVPLLMVLLEMMPAFCHGSSPHFPMKKVLLLVWKILLTILGGWKELREEKAARRIAANLSTVEDTLIVASAMKASSIYSTDTEQAQGVVRAKRALHPSGRAICRQLACTSTDSLEEKNDESEQLEAVASDIDQLSDALLVQDDEETICGNDDEESKTLLLEETDTPQLLKPAESQRANPLIKNSCSGEHTPVAGTPPPVDVLFRTSLPWRPKVREEDIEAFLQNERFKFFEYRLPGDSTTVYGLPLPIQRSVEALRRHLFVSLGDLQANREKELNRYIFSQHENDIPMTATEKLYRMMLPNFSQYIIALLKVLLAAAPSSKAKSDAINILCDVLTPETDNSDVLTNSINYDSSLSNILEQNVRVAIDINRHKEVMVKAASAILILLMKHFRLNHVYQFEYLGQHLVFGNCIPLILKFLDQNMVRYMQSKHELRPYSYPYAPIYFARNREEWPILSADNIEEHDSQSPSYFLWRNVFSTINLLRVLNKLTKWKHARTMMLVVFKSAPILKRSLRIKLAIFQLYVLKLLKMQARYLGRQWRRTNMEIMSAIYAKVRHRLNDDWAYANETRSKSWDFQNEEAALKTAVERFNSRRYSHFYPAFALEVGETSSPGDSYLEAVDIHTFEPVDNSFQSLLGKQRDLSDRFKRKYEKWVDEEVMKNHTNWDLLLACTRGVMDVL